MVNEWTWNVAEGIRAGINWPSDALARWRNGRRPQSKRDPLKVYIDNMNAYMDEKEAEFKRARSEGRTYVVPFSPFSAPFMPDSSDPRIDWEKFFPRPSRSQLPKQPVLSHTLNRITSATPLQIEVDNNGIVCAVWFDRQMLPFELVEITPSQAGLELRKKMNLPVMKAVEVVRYG